MGSQSACSAYKKVAIGTARPIDLVHRLCARAVQHARVAERQVHSDAAAARQSSRRCQDIVTELIAALDPAAGAIASDLASLYLFSLSRLRAGDRARAAGPYGEAADTLEPLASAWGALARSSQVPDASAPSRSHGAEGIQAPAA